MWIMVLLREIPLICIFIIFVPTFIAIYVSLTRITDYRHFTADVVAGAIIGGFIGYLSYLMFYNEMYLEFDYRLKIELENRNNGDSSDGDSNDGGSNDRVRSDNMNDGNTKSAIHVVALSVEADSNND